MKEFAAVLLAPFALVLMLTSIVLTLLRNMIDLVCDAYTENFSDVLELDE